MNINPIWFICIIVRLLLVFGIWYINNNYNNQLYNRIISSILLIMGLGFIYKGYTGSNNEVQISKVFWHETRYIHGIFYILSSISLYNNNLNQTIPLLLSDLVFSILYRLVSNQ